LGALPTRRGGILLTASPLGEEEPDPRGAERGGYSPIPRRDARAGVWDVWRRISGAGLAAAARATIGSESLSVIVFRVNSDEQSAKQSVRSGMDQAMRCERIERAWPSSGTLATLKNRPML